MSGRTNPSGRKARGASSSAAGEQVADPGAAPGSGFRPARRVVILGGGLAGSTLARHLLLETDVEVRILDRARRLPTPRQKYGESSVQLAGHYYGKVLDLEEMLFHEHFMKYNLRFYWKTPGLAGDVFEHYGQTYIRNYSNVPSYQLDRNAFEASVLAMNAKDPRFSVVTGISELDVQLGSGGAVHRVSYRAGGEVHEEECDWFIDATGRGQWLARRDGLRQDNGVRHGASFLWVDGLLDIERLTRLDRTERRRHPHRRITGHLPHWLATNHFMGPGFWFWVIPLRHKTSLGLVYEHGAVDAAAVDSPEKLLEWVSREFPLFAEDLKQRRVVDHGRLRDYSHGCARTIHPDRWGLVGEAGRFSDPLYSPGSDLISTYNTLLVDAIQAPSERELRLRCQQGEALMRALYEAYIPSYGISYDALGDQEAFTLKYAWELSIYFAFYVFPFINGLLTDRLGALVVMRRFAELGALNASMQRFLSDYLQWKKARGMLCDGAAHAGRPLFQEQVEFPALARAERTFYEVEADAGAERRIVGDQVDNLQAMARAVHAWVASRVLGRPEIALSSRYAIEGDGADLAAQLVFDEQAFAARLVPGVGAPDDPPLSDALSFLSRFAVPAREATGDQGEPASSTDAAPEPSPARAVVGATRA